MQLALKIDVETYRGALQGVPLLVDILRRHQASATFCFALGPDRSGCLPRVTQSSQQPTGPGISRKSHYGLAALMYGRVIPGPDIGKRCRTILKSTADAGFETAIHGWDIARWRNRIERADGVWTEIEMRRAHERYVDIFGCDSPGHAAPGSQMNPHALRLTQRLGYQWASDSYGSGPFIPVWNGEIVRCPQLPTTLPTFAQLVGFNNATVDNVHEGVLTATASRPIDGHVMTLQAEIDGLLLADKVELLLTGLREQGYSLVSLGQLRSTLDINALPRHEVTRGLSANGSWPVMLQGEEFLAQWKDAP